MYSTLKQVIDTLDVSTISNSRKEALLPLREFLLTQKNANINLIFICTHNSRRSHFSQIWAQAMAHYYSKTNIYSYSGGTEVTAIYPEVLRTLEKQGFQMQELASQENNIWSIKFSDEQPSIIGFSKTFSDEFNPQSNFAAILTCDQANEACPFVPGALKRFPITYIDPKIHDGTSQQEEAYLKSSIEIATEMKFIFQY